MKQYCEVCKRITGTSFPSGMCGGCILKKYNSMKQTKHTNFPEEVFHEERGERDNSTQAFLIVGLFVLSACLLIAVVTMRAEASLLGV